MILDFKADLSRHDVYANGVELVQIMGIDCDDSGNRITTRLDTEKKLVTSFTNPVLVTDNYRIGKLDPVLRDTVFALYSSPKRRVIYDSVAIDFEQRKFPTVWGPSIDTLLFCRALKYLKIDYQLDEFTNSVEIGSGSGFISKYILEKNPQIKKAILVDINDAAKKCANTYINDPRMSAIVGNGLKYLANKKFDMISCNPPYIPRFTTVENNPYEGIGLLSGLISDGSESLTKNGILLVNISSLCENKELKLIKDMNLNYEKIDQLDVPLKVFRVLNNQSWMDYLLSNSMKKETHNGYHYWQTLNMYKISRK